MKLQTFNKVAVLCICFALAMWVIPLYAMDRHVGSGQTYSTINAALSAASKGDVIIIHDGTYTDAISRAPVGTAWTAGNYTTVKALNDGGVTITGVLHTDPSSAYLQFEGLKFKAQADKYVEGTQIKFFRCAFEQGGTSGYGINTGVGTNNYPNATSYILFEDCWFYGIGGRYNLQLYLTDHIVVRRCVFRHDGGYGPNSGNPEAGIVNYNSQYVEMQNVIVIDSNLSTYAYWDQAFYIIYNSASAENTIHISVRGSMAINNLSNAFRWDGSSTTISIDAFTDNVGIGVSGDSGNYALVNGSSNVNLSISATKSAFKTFAYGAGDWGPGSPTVTNSFFTSISSTLYDGWSSSGSSTSSGTAWKYPPRIESGGIGPTILKKIGISGTMYGDTGYNTTTTDSLWPWPNEARIKSDMASVASVGARGFATGTSLDGSSQTLTKYIWEYLGNQIPSDIYASRLAAPSGFKVLSQ